MVSISSTVLLQPPVGFDPPDLIPPEPEGDRRRKRKKCPYCLLDLTDFTPEELREFNHQCPICFHKIFDPLISTPVHSFDRFQQWDFFANELEYIWDWEYWLLRDYREFFNTYRHEYRTTQYSDAKDRFERLNDAKPRVLRLRDEFLEAEGELDLLIIGFLEKIPEKDGGLAWHLRRGRVWRTRAVGLSAASPSHRELLQFQFDLVKAASWAVYREDGVREFLLEKLEEAVKNCKGDWE